MPEAGIPFPGPGRRAFMNIYESGEDYLEQILMLLEQKGHARSIDIAAGLNVSKPSVSVAMKKLKENGYIKMSTDNLISLTDKGYAIARKIYDRHQALTKYLIQIGVPEALAKEDACKIEHDLSAESFDAIRTHARNCH
jgi:Mn-dependent DtxR family transcriptional regulator